MAHPFAKWKAEAAPYCVLRYSAAKADFVPFRKMRFASVAEADAYGRKLIPADELFFVDFATPNGLRATATGA